MNRIPVVPQAVPQATVRRLEPTTPVGPIPVQHVVVREVAAPRAVPRRIDPVALRLMALQLENDHLRDELDQLRAG